MFSFGGVVAGGASTRTPLHEAVHFVQVWVIFVFVFILTGNVLVGLLGFYIEYVLELCIRRIITGDWYKAYKSLFMERMGHIAGQKEWPLMAFYQPKNSRWR